MKAFYSDEEEKEYGVVGIKILLKKFIVFGINS